MSVLIKGMEMPKSCRDCDFMNWGAVEPNRCGITDCFIGGDYDKRHDNCPLVPVPPHGRLIDADALRAKQQEDADLFQGSTAYGDKCRRDEAMNAVANIVNTPTIIPASFENPTKNARYSQDNPAEEGE